MDSAKSRSNIHRHQRSDDNRNQVLHCPHCGANLDYLQQPIPEGAIEAASAPHHPNSSREGNEPDTPGSFAEQDKLKQLICAPNKTGVTPGVPHPRTLRPDVLDKSQAAKDDHNNKALTRVATKMYIAMCLADEYSVDKLLRSRLQGKHYWGEPLRPEHTVKCVGSILYDHEWTGNPSPGFIKEPDPTILGGGSDTILFLSPYIFETMLLVDYGFPPCPIRVPWCWPREDFIGLVLTEFKPFCRFLAATAYRWNAGFIPRLAAWENLARSMDGFPRRSSLEIQDAATLMYYYITRYKPVDSKSAKQGWSGYTGVLQEMIREVPRRGTDRLARKLLLDINVLIPEYVTNREIRDFMLYKARRLAQEYQVSIIDAKRGGGWLDAVTNLFSFSRPAEKEKEKDL
ncbi:hypothetical protein B0J18DRAFT_476163 [Chaetomium sp. MPI-SDFR-AT-0129]|nr:hypothetical protein B0J18DRAFT_476163 [Chaetomium sp. MPI-SDFR-AT-0129]